LQANLAYVAIYGYENPEMMLNEVQMLRIICTTEEEERSFTDITQERLHGSKGDRID